jgi:hypothetical protein
MLLWLWLPILFVASAGLGWSATTLVLQWVRK